MSTAARAEIYAWVDGEGHMTLSDHLPPPGVRIIEVVSEPKQTAQPVREPNDAQVQYLTQRVQQLEHQIAAASTQPPPPPQYSTPPVSDPYGCTFWADCGPWWSTPGYPAAFGVVVAPTRGFHRFHHFRGAGFRHR